ncbi:MAG: ABC transporter ATP-binding protein [Ruminococcaceae bacterium]|jgi:putative ABC transport system ATP-binding protein|nr:ABC transporter ATP-binding protein [Oscillospiraceae bacterium]
MNIQAESLTKIYIQGEKRIYALNELSVSIAENKFTAIVGPSGCGKSTFLRALSALEKPTGGTVSYDGQDIYKLSEKKRAELRRRKIGVVYQDYSLLPTLTALENICTPSLMDGRKPDLEYIAGLAKTLGIEDRLHHIPSEMSGGEQQRVSVARALVNRPAIIFADEPTGNLDKNSARELLELLLLTKKEFDQTLLMVTHDPDIAAHADIVIRMDNGRISE